MMPNLATLLIVFREVIEAGLIVGIVLAATKGVPGRGLFVTYGVIGGIVGACLVAVFASEIAALFQGSGQELFNAGILLLAVGMLTWHNVWMASHGRAIAQEMRQVGAAVASGQRPLAALAIVCGVAVLREGSEIVLFLYSIAASGGTSALGMMAGGVLGLLAGAGVSTLMYLGLLTIPARYLFSFTSGLITLLAAGLAAQAVAFLQQAGYVDLLTSTVWDTSWLLADDSVLGRLMHTLIGYTDRPSGAQLVAYLLTIAGIVGLPVSQRIASMMTLVERWTSCQTTLRSIPSSAPSCGKMNNTTIRISMP
jgi:high-affinity iron transporter